MCDYCDRFSFEETYHACPACGTPLIRIQPSRMLVCEACESGPYFLVPKEQGDE